MVKQQTHLPVFVMVRPRGGDFLYSEHEIAVMRADLKGLRACGADGVVFGVLTKAAQVNVGLCRELLCESLLRYILILNSHVNGFYQLKAC